MTSDPIAGGAVAEPVRVRRLTGQEGRRLQQIVRRGSTSSVRYRRGMMLLASAGGNRVPVIAQRVRADEDTVRDVIYPFSEIGLACPDLRWVGDRPPPAQSWRGGCGLKHALPPSSLPISWSRAACPQ